MAVKLIQHIELRGENPRNAVIAGTNLKAYLVAQFVLGWGVDAAIEKYRLSAGRIYGAMSFYYDNLPALKQEFDQIPVESNRNGTRDNEKAEAYQREYSQKA
jgi:hypothetical protein